MNSPLFSIVIPTYNRAHLIVRAIQSLLQQNFTDFEIIVVDDGSTDNTGQVVHSMTDARIRYFKKVNEERNLARNFGIQQARGAYVGFLDSDDFVYADHLLTASQLISREHNPVWFFLNYELRDSEKSVVRTRESMGVVPEKKLIEDNFIQANGVFIRSDVAREINFPDSQSAVVGEDHFLWLRLACRHPLVIEPRATSVVWEHGERSLRNINLEKLRVGVAEMIAVLQHDQAFLRFFDRKANWYFAFKYCFVALVATDYKKYSMALQYLIRAFKTFPWIVTEKRFLAALKNSVLGIITLSR